MASEDLVLFGSTNTIITNEFCSHIETALVEGVASLPLMAEDGKEDGNSDDSAASADENSKEQRRDQKMLQKLRKSYIRNVDIVEIYAGRNIFSVSARTPHFRQRVVEAWKASQQDQSEESTDSSSINNTDNTDHDAKPVDTPPPSEKAEAESVLCEVSGKQDVPTPEMVTAMEEDMKSLRIKLEEARKLRAERSRYCEEMKQAASFSEVSREAISEVAVEKLPQAVEAMVHAQETFATLKEKGTDLIQTMDTEKKGRSMEDSENDPDKLEMTHPPEPIHKKKKLTLEEHYREHRSALTETQTRDILAVKEMLQRKKA